MQKTPYSFGWLLMSAAGFILLLFMLHSSITGLIVAVDSNQLANVLVGYIACLLIGSIVTIGLIALGRKFAPQIATGSPPRREVISLATLPPANTLPSSTAFPKTTFVRNIIEPMAPTHAKDSFEFRVSVNGLLEAKTIPIHYIRRFFACPTPRRAEWKGNVNTYSDLLHIAKHYGWVCERSDGENGVQWNSGWTDPQKRIERLQATLG